MRIKINGEVMIAAALYLLIFYLCLPYSMVILNSLLIRVIVFASAALFIIGMIFLGKEKQLLAFLVLFAFILFYWVITWSVQLDTLTYVYYGFVSLIFVFGATTLYYSEDNDLLRRMFLFITIIYFVTAITSIVGLNVYPLAARELARGSTYDTSLDFTTYKNIYRRMNIVSWSQAYGMLFALPAAWMIWKKKRKVFYVVLLAAISVMLVASQITFAVLLAIVLIAGVLISNQSSTKTIVITIILALAAILILINLDEVLGVVIELSKQVGFDFLATKLNDLRVLLLYGNAVGDAGARGMLYQKSFNTFLNSPLVGLVFKGKASMDQIGYHSEFFDFLGTFGFIGMMVMITSFVAYFRFLKRTEKDSRRDLMIIFLGFMVLFVLNPVFNSPQIFVGAFLYPLLASRYCRIGESEKRHLIPIIIKIHR